MADGGTLTLDNGPNPAVVSATGNGHQIASTVGILLNSSVDVDVNNYGDLLSIAGNISNGANGPASLTMSGAGTLIMSGANTYSGGTAVTGGILKLTSARALLAGSSLSVGANAASLFANAASTSDQVAAFATSQTAAVISNETAAPAIMTTAAPELAALSASTAAQAATLPAALTTSATTAASPISSVIGNPGPVGSTSNIQFLTATAKAPAMAAAAKAHDAAIQAWIAKPTTDDLAWLSAASELNYANQTNKHSSTDAAVDAAIIKYSN